MRDTHFVKTINLEIYNLVAFVFMFLITILMKNVIYSDLKSLTFLGTNNIILEAIGRIIFYLELITLILFLLNCIWAVIELIDRYKHDKVKDLFESILQTFKIRRFLIQKPQFDLNVNKDKSGLWNSPSVISLFNKSARKAVLDIRKDKVLLVIPDFHSVQAQNLFNFIKAEVKNEVGIYNPEVFFSDFTKDPKNNSNILEGNRLLKDK